MTKQKTNYPGSANEMVIQTRHLRVKNENIITSTEICPSHSE